MSTILLIILILLLIGALPTWPYSSGWGYWPSGGLGLILLILIILALTGNLCTVAHWTDPPLEQFGGALGQRPRLPWSRLMIRMITAITSRR
jgi:hypothetical protein